MPLRVHIQYLHYDQQYEAFHLLPLLIILHGQSHIFWNGRYDNIRFISSSLPRPSLPLHQRHPWHNCISQCDTESINFLLRRLVYQSKRLGTFLTSPAVIVNLGLRALRCGFMRPIGSPCHQQLSCFNCGTGAL